MSSLSGIQHFTIHAFFISTVIFWPRLIRCLGIMKKKVQNLPFFEKKKGERRPFSKKKIRGGGGYFFEKKGGEDFFSKKKLGGRRLFLYKI